MNYPAASNRVSKMLKLVIPHLIEPAPYLIRGNPEGKAKRPTAFCYALNPALWIPVPRSKSRTSFTGMTWGVI